MTTLPEKLLAMLAASESVSDFEREPEDPTYTCMFVDMRPAEFAPLIREAAQSLQAQEGWILVPREPTREMCDAAVHAAVNLAHGRPWFPFAWRAGITAVTSPAAAQTEGG